MGARDDGTSSLSMAVWSSVVGSTIDGALVTRLDSDRGGPAPLLLPLELAIDIDICFSLSLSL